MATVIRFARHGTKKKPYFRIVVQDKRSPRDGRFIEHIGAFDPINGCFSFLLLATARRRPNGWDVKGARSVVRELRLIWQRRDFVVITDLRRFECCASREGICADQENRKPLPHFHSQ